MPPAPHLEAELTFLTTAEGGRATPAKSGYHPQFTYEGTGWSAALFFVGCEWVHPGQSVLAGVFFMAEPPGAAYHFARLRVGQEFTAQEGSRVIARGRILRFFPVAEPLSPSAAA